MRTVVAALVIGLSASFVFSGLAENTQAAPPTGAEATDRSGIVPVPEPSPLALQYYRSGNVLWAVRQLVALAVPAVLLFSGLSARLRNGAGRIGRKWFFTIGLYFGFYAVISFVVSLPLDYYSQYVRQHSYDLSNQTFGKWLGDSFKELAISLVGGFLLLWIPYLVIRMSPRRWWLYTSLLAVPFMFLVMLIFPIWIAPLFNQFGPMKNQALEAKILALADRVGIEGSRVYEVNKSVDTKTVNAYVAGFLNTKRIVLWDTLLARLDEDQVLAVMAHEMGHYVLGHVVQGVLIGALSVFVTLYLVYRLSGLLIDRFKDRFGFDRLDDVASLPLILLLMGVLGLAVSPLGLAFSRHIERQADRFALELTHDNHALASAFARLQTENLANPRPGPFYVLWRGSHPSLAERIEFANTYRPWENPE